MALRRLGGWLSGRSRSKTPPHASHTFHVDPPPVQILSCLAPFVLDDMEKASSMECGNKVCLPAEMLESFFGGDMRDSHSEENTVYNWFHLLCLINVSPQCCSNYETLRLILKPLVVSCYI